MKIDDIRWINLQTVCDNRGCLTAIEFEQIIPFEVKRVFYMHNVVQGADRGGHAHRDTDQFAIALHGSMKIIISDGLETRTVILDNPGWGINLPRLTWTSLVDFSDGAVCMVLASTQYDKSRSIRTWSEYLTELEVPHYPELSTGPALLHPENK